MMPQAGSEDINVAPARAEKALKAHRDRIILPSWRVHPQPRDYHLHLPSKPRPVKVCPVLVISLRSCCWPVMLSHSRYATKVRDAPLRRHVLGYLIIGRWGTSYYPLGSPHASVAQRSDTVPWLSPRRSQAVCMWLRGALNCTEASAAAQAQPSDQNFQKVV